MGKEMTEQNLFSFKVYKFIKNYISFSINWHIYVRHIYVQSWTGGGGPVFLEGKFTSHLIGICCRLIKKWEKNSPELKKNYEVTLAINWHTYVS